MEKITFGKELATTIGLNESIVLERLYKHVEKEGTPLNGHVWMERTYEEWREDFPFWSIATIKRIFTSLKKQGLILIEQHGKHRYDRTNWYALAQEGDQAFIQDNTSNAQPQQENGLEEKMTSVQKQLQKLRFFPLRDTQKKELAHACRHFPLEQISQALEVTAERAIFAWKYAYKVLLSNKKTPSSTFQRKIIRTERVPDWFQKEEHLNKMDTTPQWNEEALAKKQRLEAIQEKYRKRETIGLC
ncbi:hypothetical protein [Lederbergia galactosidilytica]|uniref:hypothetical protein n=1 Tax=Lederbergia galactosidilytica TaxID=217031 RepID=UPI0007174DE4|nr:hypothetical protein [Lederbergia galactosidilytica]MBP1913988.1 Fe2+ or Zn2+ uptake regulation protein [Lederbergia galactosidilytica]